MAATIQPHWHVWDTAMLGSPPTCLPTCDSTASQPFTRTPRAEGSATSTPLAPSSVPCVGTGKAVAALTPTPACARAGAQLRGALLQVLVASCLAQVRSARSRGAPSIDHHGSLRQAAAASIPNTLCAAPRGAAAHCCHGAGQHVSASQAAACAVDATGASTSGTSSQGCRCGKVQASSRGFALHVGLLLCCQGTRGIAATQQLHATPTYTLAYCISFSLVTASSLWLGCGGCAWPHSQPRMPQICC